MRTSTADIFHAVVLDDKSAEAVAQEFDTSVGAVYSIKSRIIRQLKDEAEGLIKQLPRP